MATFYFFSGVNHFMRPENYKRIIPPYIHFHSLINYAAGFVEIFLAVLLVIPATRRFACTAIMAMLIAFIPAHIYMFQSGWCVNGSCFPQWAIWLRLLVLQPLLIYWAWRLRRSSVD
jgi:uncharacterized membrane protein